MKSNFTYDQTGEPKVDRALARVATAFAAVDKPTQLVVVQVNAGGDYHAVGNEDLFVVSRTARIILPTPAGVPWRFSVKQTDDGTVTILPASPSITVDGTAPGKVVLDLADASASLATDGKVYYVIGGSASAPPLPPIPPFPPIVPPVPPGPPPAVNPWFAPIAFSGTGPYNDSSGSETWKAESMIDFTGAPAQLSAYWAFESQSAGGNGLYVLRVGGSAFQALDGIVIASFIDPFIGLTPHSVIQPWFPPTGLQRVTLSMKSASSGQDAKIGYFNVLFR